MNRKKQRKAEIPGLPGIFALYMILALAVLTGCGRQGLEFYTQEELTETSQTQDSDPDEEKSQVTDDGETDPQGGTSVDARSADQAAQAETADPPSNEEAAAEETASAGIFVDVCGAVASPGVYELAADSRVFQAIEMAGGYLPEAAQSYLNRASVLADGQQIYVPTQTEVDENPEKFRVGTGGSSSGDTEGLVSGGEAEAGSGSGKVNLNTAAVSELTELTGIGESKAQAIIAYREANGGFQTIEDLMKVDGIKEGTYAKIKDQITVE